MKLSRAVCILGPLHPLLPTFTMVLMEIAAEVVSDMLSLVKLSRSRQDAPADPVNKE